MSHESPAESAEELERLVASLSEQLARAQEVVRQWGATGTSLSRSTAEARAENQGAGRGFFGGLFGSKFRSIVRISAAASNASIAKDVAAKRRRIADAKGEAQELVQGLKSRLAEARLALRQANSEARSKPFSRKAAAQSASASLDLLAKLKEAHAAGLLTDAEFQEKRRKLVSEL